MALRGMVGGEVIGRGVELEVLGHELLHGSGGGDLIHDDLVGAHGLGEQSLAQEWKAGDDPDIGVDGLGELACVHDGPLIGNGQDDGGGLCDARSVEDFRA